MVYILRLSDIVEENIKVDAVHAEAGLLPPSSQPTPTTTRTERGDTEANKPTQRKETDAEKLREFTKGAFTGSMQYKFMDL